MLDDALKKSSALKTKKIVFRDMMIETQAVREELHRAGIQLEIEQYDCRRTDQERKLAYTLVELTDLDLPAVFSIDTSNGIWISTSSIKLKSPASGLSYAQGVALAILCALPMMQVLNTNDAMRVEYLHHDSACGCILGENNLLAEHRSQLHICQGSIEFYTQLHAGQEIKNLQAFISYARSL